MSKNYIVNPTNNQLIAIQALAGRYRNKWPKEHIMDAAQLAYLAIKASYGTNYIITPSLLMGRMGIAESTFNDNFCGGINGFLAVSERVVMDRFHEAVEGADADLDSALNAGLRALFRINQRSRYNTYQKTHFDMNLRTRFAAEAFSSDYWEQLMAPLFPAIDAYLTGENGFWDMLEPSARREAHRLFAVLFQWLIRLMTKEGLSRYLIIDQGKYLKTYITLYKKLLNSIAASLSPNRFSFTTELGVIMERIAEAEKGEGGDNDSDRSISESEE